MNKLSGLTTLRDLPPGIARGIGDKVCGQNSDSDSMIWLN